MKSTIPTICFSPQSSREKKESSNTRNGLSPYLKAILSGASRLVSSGNQYGMEHSDREAAIRYIKESASMKK